MKKVFIDPGHGGTDSGAVGISNLLEKDINLSVAKKVEVLLKKQGLDVKLSRYKDETLSLGQRTKSANLWKADCFISIHCNAFNKSAKGVETYSYNSTTSDLAKKMHSEVLNTKAYTLDRGVKTSEFYVLRNTTMRSSLIELAFIDNVDDTKILTQKQDDLAFGIAKGICKYFKIDCIPIDGSETFYRVVCGSYNKKVYAQGRVKELNNLGIKDAFITVYKKIKDRDM